MSRPIRVPNFPMPQYPLTAPLTGLSRGLALALLLGAAIPQDAGAQSTKRARPAGSGVPAPAVPVARAQPNNASAGNRELVALRSATPMALPNGEASGAPVPAASNGAGLDPRVFRVDPRDEVIVVSPLQAPRMDYAKPSAPVARTEPAKTRRSAVPPPAVTRIVVEPAADPEEPTRITVASRELPNAMERVPATPKTPAVRVAPDPELDRRSAGRSRARLVRDGTVATLSPSDLAEYSRQPARVKHLIKNALALTDMGLGYKFGGGDPARGGLDCSGTVFATLNRAGMRGHPRDSFSQYQWLVEHKSFHAAKSSGFGRFSMDKLKPGDLLFWVNTYKTRRNPPVTHVAIYLGTEKRTGRHVMVHAGGGRRYNGKSRRGVTVANFELPDKMGARGGKGSFLGWGSIPGVR